MSIGRLLKKIAPIAVGSFFGPAALGSTGLSPFFQRAVTGALASKIGGAKTKDALVAGALSGGLGALFGGTEAGAGSQATKVGASKAGSMSKDMSKELARNQAVPDSVSSAASKTATDAASEGIKKVVTGDGASPSFLNMLGIGDDSLTGKFLSSGIGQGLTAGLLMQLLAGGEDEGDMRSEFERRPFGTGGPGGKLGGITYANLGGAMNFPRRDGGIDPSEGSGTKDDVPAMLTAGEFVLTKDAVKGLGGGNQRRGIERAYDMMNKLEARA
tara:strand:+ start:451 stop:1266 length:816 start_codon:yes stop_codon:yes gene_type:complete